MSEQHTITRRQMMRHSAILVVSVCGLPTMLAPRPVRAGSASKDDFHYQAIPHQRRRCADCSAFQASAQGTEADGTCRIVAGPISPNGWCMAFSAK